MTYYAIIYAEEISPYTVHCTLYTVHCKLYSVQYIVSRVQSTVYIQSSEKLISAQCDKDDNPITATRYSTYVQTAESTKIISGVF